jgi:hypothetical protein
MERELLERIELERKLVVGKQLERLQLEWKFLERIELERKLMERLQLERKLLVWEQLERRFLEQQPLGVADHVDRLSARHSPDCPPTVVPSWRPTLEQRTPGTSSVEPPGFRRWMRSGTGRNPWAWLPCGSRVSR